MRRNRGFTIIELIVVLTCVAILAIGMVWPAMQRSHQRAALTSCTYNLKIIYTANATWAGDNDDTFPTTLTKANMDRLGFSNNVNQAQYCWKLFNTISNELGNSPKVLICPFDIRQVDPINYTTNPTFKVANTNISYFVSINQTDTTPSAVLLGDRNLAPGLISSNDFGYSHTDGSGNDVTLSTNSPICWSLNMHSQGKSIGIGNILLVDGSVQQSSSMSLRTQIQPFAGASLTNQAGTNILPSGSFRLLFP